jgi:hypothetical protein
MLDLGAAHLNAALAAERQAKAEINLLEIAKEALIESAGREIGVAGVEGGGSAGANTSRSSGGNALTAEPDAPRHAVPKTE